MGGINDWIDGNVLKILEACGVPLPGGDGDTLRSMAAAWDTMGNELTAMAQAIDLAVSNTDQDWSGDARQAFDQSWQKQKQAIDDVADHFHQVSAGLQDYAKEIDDINKAIIDICVQIAEMEIGGIALSFLTAGISDAIANVAVAERVAKVADLVKLFTSAAEKVASLLERFLGLGERTAKVLEVLAKFGASFTKSFVTNFVGNEASAMAGHALNGTPVDLKGDAKASAYAAVATAGFSAGGETLAKEAGITGALGNVLKGEGRLGTSLNGALGNAAGGLNADLHDPTKKGSDLWQDALTNTLFGALGNAQNDFFEGKRQTGGENLSEKAKLMDSLHSDAFGTTLGAAMSTGGGGIESDIQGIFGKDPFETTVNKNTNNAGPGIQSDIQGVAKSE